MSTSTPIDPRSPLAEAWKKYASTPEYENTFRWASSPEDTEGSLWAAFSEGFLAAEAEVARLHGEVERLRAALEEIRDCAACNCGQGRNDRHEDWCDHVPIAIAREALEGK